MCKCLLMKCIKMIDFMIDKNRYFIDLTRDVVLQQ